MPRKPKAITRDLQSLHDSPTVGSRASDEVLRPLVNLALDLAAVVEEQAAQIEKLQDESPA